MSKTAVGADLLQPLEVFTELIVQCIGQNMGSFTIFVVAVSVDEPIGNLELAWVVDDRHQLLQLFWAEFSGSPVDVDVCLFADQHSESAADTFDDRQGKRHLNSAVHIRIENTNNLLEIRREYERHFDKTMKFYVQRTHTQMPLIYKKLRLK